MPNFILLQVGDVWTVVSDNMTFDEVVTEATKPSNPFPIRRIVEVTPVDGRDVVVTVETTVEIATRAFDPVLDMPVEIEEPIEVVSESVDVKPDA